MPNTKEVKKGAKGSKTTKIAKVAGHTKGAPHALVSARSAQSARAAAAGDSAPEVKPAVPSKFGKTILKDVRGNDVDETLYFFDDGVPQKNTKGEVVEVPLCPPYFNNVVGKPVDREDLVEVFNKVFLPEDGFLFYKCVDKEVYVVIVPLKYSNVTHDNDCVFGDYQKHSVSFIAEGSANPETLKLKLDRVAKNVGYTRVK